MRGDGREDVRLERDEGVYGLACQVVGDADDGGLGDTRVEDERGLDLGGREAMARDVDDVCECGVSAKHAVRGLETHHRHGP